MRPIAAPGVIVRPFDYLGAHRVGFDISQHGEQVLVVLNDRAFESALPDVAARSVALMIPLSVRHEQTLHDSADRVAERLNEQVEMVVQEAVAVKLKGLSLFQVAERLQERLEVGVLMKDVLPVVSAVDDVINQAIADGA